jgi:hypothetical protein
VPKFVADSSVSPTGLKWAVDPVADVVTTAGDLIYGTAADTVARLGIGTAGQVLQVNSGATAPEWATPAGGGGGLTLLETLSISGASTTSSSIAGTYTNLYVIVKNAVASTNTDFFLRFNSDSGGSYVANKVSVVAASTVAGSGNTSGTNEIRLSDIGTDSTASGKCTGTFTVNRYADTDQTFVTANFYALEGSRKATFINGIYDQSAAITTLTLGVLSGTVTGTAYIYGVS